MSVNLSRLLFLCLATGAGFAAPLPVLLEPARQPGEFLARGPRFTLQLTAQQLALRTPHAASTLRWHGARPAARLHGETLTPTRLHDLRGADPAAWRPNLPAYSTARARQLYPGIDLVYHSRAGALEFDLELAPHADPARLQFSLPGATLSPAGDLQLPGGFTWKRPIAFQGQTPVPVAYTPRGPGRFGFTLGAYNPAQPLLIDPVLNYATYLGGTLADDARAVAADPAGNSYVIGSTLSTDYPGAAASQPAGSQDIVVTKLNPAGTAILWATYLGGQSVETGLAIAVDAAGNVFGAGSTASTNFPVSPDAPQRSLGGGSGIIDGIVFRLNPAGNSLAWSSFLGGSLNDLIRGIAVDPTGAVYVAGRTDSTDFPNTSRSSLPARGGGDAFVTKFNATGTAIVYSLLLGGFAFDAANAIAVDA
ncbi:MAG: SBBP repeat-containing protein, partial [Acidobacteriota bacterium]